MIFNYTMLNTWLICPHQAARRYIIKDIPFEKTAAMEEGSNGHKAFEERIRRKIPLPVDLQKHESLVAPLDKVHVKPEQKLGVTYSGRPTDFFAGDVWFRGILDAPFLLATDTCILIDWKFGKPREDPFELETNAVLMQAHEPILEKLYGQYVWLKEGKRGKLHNLSDTRRTWARIHALAAEIEAGDDRKTPGPLCAWCNVFDCQHNAKGLRRAKSA